MPEVDYRNIKDGPSQSIRSYVFTLKSADISSGSLSTAGAKTITLRRTPFGIGGANIAHYIRISGGTGTAECCLITGGTCVSGTDGGTLQFTTVNTHTGDWSITSATGGIQEWFYGADMPLNGFLGPGATTLYAKLTLYGRGGNTVCIFGNGNPATYIKRDPSYPSGDLILYDSSITGGQIIMDNFAVHNAVTFDNPSGSGIHLIINQVREAILTNITVYNGVSPILVDPVNVAGGAGYPIFDNVYVSIQTGYIAAGYATGDGITLNVGGAKLIEVRSTRDIKSATGGSGLKIIRADGIEIYGGYYNGTHGIVIQNNSSYILNFIYIDNVLFDECYSHGVNIPVGAHNAVFDTVKILNSHFATQSGGAAASGIYVGNGIENLLISGNQIQGFTGAGINLGLTDTVPKSVVIIGNEINNNLQGITIAPTGSGGAGSYDTHTVISGNVIGNNLTKYGAATQQVGIYFAGAAGKWRGYTIEGNDLSGNTVLPIVKDATPTLEGIRIGTNGGVSDSFALVASASLSAANAAGMYRNIEVSGTTNVTSLTPVWDGREITIIKTDAGTVNFTAAGNIAAAVAIAQYGRLDFIYYVALGKWIGK